MNPISKFVWKFSANARKKRAEVFKKEFDLNSDTKVLDLGSENGTHINMVLSETPVKPENIYIADIDTQAIEEGKKLYGYNPVLISENEKTPFSDKFFDIVYCSSVIEHTTVKKEDLWN